MLPASPFLEAGHDQGLPVRPPLAPQPPVAAATAATVSSASAAVPPLPQPPPAQSPVVGPGLSFIPSQDRQAAIQEFQQRLVLLYHASKCEHSDELSLGRCRVSPFCRDMRCLWDHANACTSQSCTFPHCISTRFLLAHFYKCEEPDCVICKPLKDSIKRIHKRTRNIVRVSPRRSESCESDESPMPSPRDMLSPRDSISPRDAFYSPRSDLRNSPRDPPLMLRDLYYQRDLASSPIDPKRSIPRANVHPNPIKAESVPTMHSSLPTHYPATTAAAAAAAATASAAPVAPFLTHPHAHVPPLPLHQLHFPAAASSSPRPDCNRHGVPPICLHNIVSVVASDGESTDANTDDFVTSKYMRPTHHEKDRVATEEQLLSCNSVDSLTTALESFTDDFSMGSKPVALSCGRCSVAITSGYRYHCAVCQVDFCSTCFHCESGGEPHEHPVRAFLV